MGPFTVLNNVVQGGLDDKRNFNRTYEWDPEGHLMEERCRQRGNSMCKGPGAGPVRIDGGAARMPARLSEQAGEREEGRAGRGTGGSCRAVWATGGGLGLSHRGRGDLKF